jgi:hypothetical protein
MVLGSGIRDPEKTYSGSRIQGSKSTRSRIRIRNTGHQAVFRIHFEKDLILESVHWKMDSYLNLHLDSAPDPALFVS